MFSTVFITFAAPLRARSRIVLFEVDDWIHPWRRQGWALACGRMDRTSAVVPRQALCHLLCVLRLLVLGEQFFVGA